MRSLPKPNQDPLETFELCISRIKDHVLKRRLESIRDEIRRAAKEYEQCGDALCFHGIDKHDHVDGIPSKVLESVYTSRMVGKTSPGRRVYEQLRSSAPQNLCPFCAQRIVGTLDHYLPKSDFPSLVVVPNNLVPSCRDCNSTKMTYFATDEAEQLLHPYFDDFSEDQWLFAELVEGSAVALNYFVQQTDGITDKQFVRLENNFSVLGLGELYASHAAAELANIHFHLTEILEYCGPEDVRNHLLQAYRSRCQAHINSWQTALYQAISHNNWFYEGGFREIG